MKRHLSVALVAVTAVAALCTVPARAEDDAATLDRDELTALRAAQRRCRALAGSAPDSDVFSREIEHARSFLPLDPTAGAPDAIDYTAERAAHDHAASLAELAAVARRRDAVGGREGHDRVFARCVDVFGLEASARAFAMVWSTAYLTWLHPDDARRIDEGWERLGEWLSPPEVAAIDAEHAAAEGLTEWRDVPYVVRTRRPVREAVTLLAHARDVRARLQEWFPNRTKSVNGNEFPIVLCDTRAEFEAALGPSARDARFAALYVRNDSVGPVVVARQVRLADGSLEVTDPDALLWVLRHELAHQDLHERFRFVGGGRDAAWDADAHAWLVEGVATYAAEWETGPSGARLRRVAERAFGSTRLPGPFAWCREHRDDAPSLADMIGWGRAAFTDAAAYRWAATFVHFLMDGGDESLRLRLVELVGAVHAGWGPERTLAAAFPGDPDALQTAFTAFLDTIEIEPATGEPQEENPR